MGRVDAILARPKSSTFTTPPGVIMTFAGLKPLNGRRSSRRDRTLPVLLAAGALMLSGKGTLAAAYEG